MSKVFITGSTDGLGLAAARQLISEGHAVVGHARSAVRAEDHVATLPGLQDVLVADLGSIEQTVQLAHDANQLGAFDAVIHNAGVGYRERRRIATAEGHAHVLAINVLAPYVLTAKMLRPARLVYLSSGMHVGGDTSLEDLDWTERGWDGAQAYSDSKLFDATLAMAVARRWDQVLSNAVEPGWVATKMGGAGAPDDLALAHVTQAWLAVSDDREARVSGEYFYHRRLRQPHPATRQQQFQEELLSKLESLTGVRLASS